MTRSPARRLQTMQTRATEYVRTSGMSVRTNGPPDGWMGTNGPVWWLGSDGLNDNLGSLQAYGLPPRSRGGYPTVFGGEPYVRPFDSYQGTTGVLPAITRATSIVVGPVVRTTWRYSEGTATDISDMRAGTEVFPRPLWIADPQLVGRIPGGDQARPTVPFPKRLGAHDYWRTLLTHALWFGAGAMLYTEDAYGQPLAGTLRVVNPDRWGWTEDGRYVLGLDSDDPLESDLDGYFTVGPYRWRMVLLRGFAPNDGNVAEGALTRSGLLLQTGTAMGSYLAGIMASGVPAGVLKVNVPNFGPADAEGLRTRWMEAHGGVKKSVAVLNAGVDFTPLQLSVVDSDVVNARGSWLVDVAHAFNLSSAYLDASTGSGGNITYANLSDRRRDLLDLTLADWGRSMEDLITALLPFGQKMRVDWSGFLNTDPNQDLAFVRQGLEMGYLTPAEARDRLGLRPLEEGPATEATDPRNVVEMVQKVYLGVGKVISAQEARDLLNQAGAGLTGPPPAGLIPSAGGAPVPPNVVTPEEIPA